MNLADLTKIDIKNIDIGRILKTLRARKDILVNVVVVFATIFVMVQIYSNKHSENQALEIKLDAQKKKSAPIADYNKAQKDLNAFLDALPKGIPEYSIIDKLSDFAEKHNIQILSFSPAKSRSETL